MVPPASHRVSRVPWYSGYRTILYRFRLQDCHLLWSAFPNGSTSNIRSSLRSTTPTHCWIGLGSFPFARHYLGNRGFFLFLRVLRCFSSPGVPSITYGFSDGYLGITPGGLPHSEIHGSKPAFGSPWLIADRCVLHRLLVPRHSPYALSSLISLESSLAFLVLTLRNRSVVASF